MGRFYFNSNRVIDILERNKIVSYKILDSKELKAECFQYLAYIYQFNSEVPLNNLDFKNFENIFYMFCLPEFGKCFEPDRIDLTRNLLDRLKKNNSQIYNLLSKLSYNYYISP